MMIKISGMIRIIGEKGNTAAYLGEKENILRKNTKEITKLQREVVEREVSGRLDERGSGFGGILTFLKVKNTGN